LRFAGDSEGETAATLSDELGAVKSTGEMGDEDKADLERIPEKRWVLP
jgi:hypothetical protein